MRTVEFATVQTSPWPFVAPRPPPIQVNIRVLLKLVASIALFGIVLWFIGPSRVTASFANADPGWMLAGLLASVIASLLSALRWHALATWLGVAVPRRDMIVAYWQGITANAILPGATLGGDALRAMHLQRSGQRLIPAVASVFLDRLSGLWVLVVLSLAMTALAQRLGLLPHSLFPIAPSLTALLAILALTAPLVAWRISTSLHWLPQRARDLLRAMHERPQPLRQYLAQLLWSSGVQMFSIAAFTCGGYAVGLDLPWWQFVIAAGPVFVLAALPVGIGGWGTREAAAALALGGFGAAREAAVACAILYGLFATLQGLLGAISLLHTKGRTHG